MPAISIRESAPRHRLSKPRGNVLQRAQRAATREQILKAATEVFAAKGYAHTSVADILEKAEISRGTFYANFLGKVDVLHVIADTFAPTWIPLWDELLKMSDFSLEQLRPWCTRHVEIYREHSETCVIITQGAAIEPDFYARLAHDQELLIDRLANHSRLCHLKTDKAARTRAALALGQIDNACYFLAVRRHLTNPAVGIDVMANSLLHFFAFEQQVGLNS